ncbi:hypothetical protein GPALN_011522 [Globodera pallida]|nr:hypothetical protein GPALN_011522 [Globodera pallida]
MMGSFRPFLPIAMLCLSPFASFSSPTNPPISETICLQLPPQALSNRPDAFSECPGRTPSTKRINKYIITFAEQPQQQQQRQQQKMFDGVQTTAAAAGTPTATTTDPRDSFITTLCSCTHQQQPRQQPIRLSRKTKSDRTRRIRVSTSLPNCALSREPKAEAEQHQSDVTAPEPVSSASVLNCSHKQQQQQQKGRGGRGCVVGAVEKAKSRGPPEQRQQHNHHTPQHMAFLGTVRETVEFLRGTIGILYVDIARKFCY